MATSGPGATNLVTPLADANMDSVPMVAVTGQVGAAAIGTDAFQEADIRGITMPITKHNFLVTDPAEIPRMVAEAFYIASTGRPGPVLVDVAKSALQAQTTFTWPTELNLPGYRPVTPTALQADPRGHPADARVAPAGALRRRRRDPRPRLARSCACSAELTGIPVVTTLMARGAFPDSHPQHLGMPGMHGTVAAVAGLQKSDLIISLGARFDDRVTGNLDSFAPGAKVIHADIDPAEIGKNRVTDVPIVGDCREVIADLVVALQAEQDQGNTGDYEGWVKFLAGVKQQYPLGYDAPAEGLAPQYVHRAAQRIAGPEAIYVAGVGQHQMWATHFVGYENPRTWINSGGLGTMGFAVPAAMGAKVGRPDATVWADRRRRLLPDDQPGARHLHDRGHPDQGRDHQQRVARHGAAVADALLRGPLLQHRPARDSAGGSPTSSSSPRRTARRAGLRRARPTSTPRSTRRWRSTTSRWSSTSGSSATRWCGRWSPPARPTTTSSTPATSRPSSRRTTSDDAPTRCRVLVENKPGVLARIAGLFSRRGFNIDSLAVGPTEHPEISRMTIVVNVEESPLEQVTKQLNKLVEVIKIVELEDTDVHRARAAAGQGEGRRRHAAARCSTPSSCSAPRSSTSPPTPSRSRSPATSRKLKDFLAVIEPFGIRELVQSGMVAIGRGSRSITERTLRPVPVPPLGRPGLTVWPGARPNRHRRAEHHPSGNDPTSQRCTHQKESPRG